MCLLLGILYFCCRLSESPEVRERLQRLVSESTKVISMLLLLSVFHCCWISWQHMLCNRRSAFFFADTIWGYINENLLTEAWSCKEWQCGITSNGFRCQQYYKFWASLQQGMAVELCYLQSFYSSCVSKETRSSSSNMSDARMDQVCFHLLLSLRVISAYETLTIVMHAFGSNLLAKSLKVSGTCLKSFFLLSKQGYVVLRRYISSSLSIYSLKWVSKNVNITCLPACLIFFLALALVLIQSACCSWREVWCCQFGTSTGICCKGGGVCKRDAWGISSSRSGKGTEVLLWLLW